MKTEHTPQWDANDAAELIFREIAAMNGVRTLRDKAEAWIELNQKYKAERDRLKAANAEMLEALKDLLTVLDRIGHKLSPEDCIQVAGYEEPAYEKARAAIKKAEAI